MQCPRCGATVSDTMSRCGQCASPLRAAPPAQSHLTGHDPGRPPLPDPAQDPAAGPPGRDGLPPIQHAPLGAPIYETGGPPVQAFVEPAEDAWRPHEHLPAGPASSQPGEPSGWPAPAQPPHLQPPQPPAPAPAVPQQPATPQPAQPAQPAYPPQMQPAQSPGDMAEPPGEATQMWTPPPEFNDPRAAATPPMPYEAAQDESVVERTMAVWLADSPPAAGQGRNDTAVLPEPAPGQQTQAQQTQAWQPESWQPAESWQPESWRQPGQGGPGPDGFGSNGYGADGYPAGNFAPGGFGPGGPGAAPPPTRQAGGASKPLVFTVLGLVAVALVAAAVVLWPDGGGDPRSGSSTSPSSAAAADSPAPTATTDSVARREAVAVNRVLNASAASRGELARALAAAGNCKGLPTAIAGFERVATERRAQAARTRALKVGRLPNGARLRQTLARATQYSLAADQALLTWAQGRQGCHGKPKPDANFRRAGGPLSAQASAAKAQFATLWAPVARQHHLPPRTANSF
jgi:hypothetical protein